jgi:hypothetical protein
VVLFEAIRRDHAEGGISIRGLADRHGVHRRTVRQALASAVPPERKAATRAAPALDRWKPAIDAMLREDLDAPRKQRHTAKRVFDRLVDEHEASVSYSTVRAYVHDRRPQIDAEAGRRVAEAFIAQEHAPGREAEVDFADIWVILAGVKTKLYLFTLRPVAPRPRSRGSCWAGPEPSPIGGSRSGPITASTRSTACPGRMARMRRAASRVRVAGSAATTWSPCRGSRRSRS